MPFLLALLLTSQTLGGVAFADPAHPVELSPLFGKVQTVSTTTTIAGRVGDRVMSHYDTQGREIETGRYSSDGALRERTTHSYNARGQRIATLTKTPGGEVRTRTFYLYDLQGRRSERTTLDSVGVIDRTIYTHDTTKNTVDETTTYTHRAVTLRVTRFFDQGGREIQVFVFERNGSVTNFSTAVLATNAILNAGTDVQKSSLLPDLASGARLAALAVTEPNGQWDPQAIELIAPPPLWAARRNTPPEFLRYACGHLDRQLIKFRHVIVENPVLLLVSE